MSTAESFQPQISTHEHVKMRRLLMSDLILYVVPVINNQTLNNSPIVIRSLAAELSYNQNQCSVNFISAQRYSNSNQHWILPERFTGRLLPLCRLVTYQFSLLKQNTHLHIFLVPSPLSIFSSKCGDSFLTDTYHQKSWSPVSAVSQEVIPMSLCLTCTQHTHLVV